MMRPYGELAAVDLRRAPDLAAAAAAAAELFAELATDAVRRAGRFSVALSGGATPKAMFASLTGLGKARVPWHGVWIYWGDERAVPPTHPDSNYGMAKAHLLDHVPVPGSQVFRIKGELPAAEAARDYAATLRRTLAPGPRGWPRLDLALLGLGEDGHTASLFPGTSALSRADAEVVANFVPALGAERLTLTYPVINAADTVAVLVCGAAKADIVRAVLLEPAQPTRRPIQAVRPASGRYRWLVDAAAARGLPDRPPAPASATNAPGAASGAGKDP